MRVVVALALCLSIFPALAVAAPDLIILVRHAEKEATPADNPHLTPAGRERAAELARVVAILTARTPQRAIFSTDYLRTRETAEPLSKQTHVALTTADKDTADRIRAISGGAVVVVVHSNTIPELIQSLGGPAGVMIADPEFNHLYLLAGTSFAALTYGK